MLDEVHDMRVMLGVGPKRHGQVAPQDLLVLGDLEECGCHVAEISVDKPIREMLLVPATFFDQRSDFCPNLVTNFAHSLYRLVVQSLAKRCAAE